MGVVATEARNLLLDPRACLGHQFPIALLPPFVPMRQGASYPGPLMASTTCSSTTSAVTGGSSRCQNTTWEGGWVSLMTFERLYRYNKDSP